MSHMRVVALSKKLDNSRNLSMIAEKHEAESCDCSSSDVVVDVGDSDVQEFPDRFVVPGPCIRQSDREHPSVPHDGVLLVLAHASRLTELTFSSVRFLITSSAFSRWPYITNAIPTARDRMIFSCCVSRAYDIISSSAFSEAVPSMTRPIAYPAASPAVALSWKRAVRISS